MGALAGPERRFPLAECPPRPHKAAELGDDKQAQGAGVSEDKRICRISPLCRCHGNRGGRPRGTVGIGGRGFPAFLHISYVTFKRCAPGQFRFSGDACGFYKRACLLPAPARAHTCQLCVAWQPGTALLPEKMRISRFPLGGKRKPFGNGVMAPAPRPSARTPWYEPATPMSSAPKNRGAYGDLRSERRRDGHGDVG